MVEVSGQLSNQITFSRIMRLHGLLGQQERRSRVKPVTPRHSAKRLSKSEVTDLVAGYQAGATAPELAKRFGIARTTVLITLEREGVPRRYRRMTSADTVEAARLYRSGQSLSVVGQHFQVNPSTILNHLRQAGVPIRDTHGRGVRELKVVISYLSRQTPKLTISTAR
jgi:hypothetical protein